MNINEPTFNESHKDMFWVWMACVLGNQKSRGWFTFFEHLKKYKYSQKMTKKNSIKILTVGKVQLLFAITSFYCKMTLRWAEAPPPWMTAPPDWLVRTPLPTNAAAAAAAMSTRPGDSIWKLPPGKTRPEINNHCSDSFILYVPPGFW